MCGVAEMRRQEESIRFGRMPRLFFDTFSTPSGGNDEVATIAMRLQIGYGGSPGVGLEAYEVRLLRSGVVVGY